MKRSIIAFVLLIVLVLPGMAIAQEPEITVLVNGEKLVTDVAPQIVNDRTMLPMRAIFESLGAKVSWIEKDRIIIATKDDAMIALQIDVPVMSVQKIGNNENKAIELDVAPFISDSRTLVPVRAIAEALDAEVEWVGETRTVIITQK